MKKLRKIIATIAILTIAVSAMGCKMIEKTPEAIQKTVLATVGSEKITVCDKIYIVFFNSYFFNV